jgi:septum formation protein
VTYRLILASVSPRRRELLSLLGLPFDVVPAEVDESPSGGDESPRAFALRLAEAKARAVLAPLPACDRVRAIVLGADTVVVAPGERVLGKPADATDARRMLRMLSGTTHSVITGVAFARYVGRTASPFVQRHAEETRVTFRELSDAMVEGYLATGESYDKAGAYGVQERAAPFVSRIEGDYFNVVGLPLHSVARLLEDAGLPWWRAQDAR